MRYSLIKANVISFPTLAFNKGTIIGNIDVLQTIATQLSLTNEIVTNKIMIMRRDLFTV